MQGHFAATEWWLKALEFVMWAAFGLILLGATFGWLHELVPEVWRRLILSSPSILGAAGFAVMARVGIAVVRIAGRVEEQAQRAAGIDHPWPAHRVEIRHGYEISAEGDGFMTRGRRYATLAEAQRTTETTRTMAEWR